MGKNYKKIKFSDKIDQLLKLIRLKKMLNKVLDLKYDDVLIKIIVLIDSKEINIKNQSSFKRPIFILKNRKR